MKKLFESVWTQQEPKAQPQAHKLLSATLLRNMNSLIRYVNESLGAQEDPQRKEFVEVCLGDLGIIVDQYLVSEDGPFERNSQDLIPLLNRLAVHFYQVASIATSQRRPIHKRRATEMLEHVLCFAMSLVLRQDHVGPTLAKLDIFRRDDVVALSSMFDTTFPEAETVVIIKHICERFRSPGATIDFRTILVTNFHVGSQVTTRDDIARVMCGLCIVAPLLPFDSRGNLSAVETAQSSALANSIFDVVTPHVERFISNSVAVSSRTSHEEKRLGRALVRWLYRLVTSFGWSSTDSLLKALFRAYSSNDMLELFGSPKTSASFFSTSAGASTKGGDDTDFGVFLKLVAVTLGRKQSNAHIADKKMADRIRSLVFSLSPNNGRSFNEQDGISEKDIASIIHRYELYLTLYRFAPSGCKPRLTNIENLVDFTKCHFEICNVTLCAWSGIAEGALLGQAVLSELDEIIRWAQKMGAQAVRKHQLAREEVVNDLSATGQNMSKAAEDVIKANQATSANILVQILQKWSDAVVKCTTERQARIFLLNGVLAVVMGWAKTESNLGEEVAFSLFRLLRTYLQKSPNARAEDCINLDLQKQLRAVLANRLTSPTAPSDAFITDLTYTWFVFARSMVQSGHKTWDDYLDPHSNLSFDMLADTETSRHAKTIFITKVISFDQMYFDFNKVHLYVFWIERLLQPSTSLRFEPELTKAFLERDPDTLALQDLRSVLAESEDSTDSTLEVFRESRLVIVVHLIRNIYSLKDDLVDEFDDTRLNNVHGTKLLRSMANTMKATWISLNGKPELQDPWTEFIQSVVLELKIYPYPGFVLDSWYTDNQQFPSKNEILDDLFFTSRARPSRELDYQMVTTFRKHCERIISQQSSAVLFAELFSTFCCTDMGRITSTGEFTVDIALQTSFIQNVFPAYIEHALLEPGHVVAVPLLELMRHITENIQVRIDNQSRDTMESFLRANVTLLSSAVRCLQEVEPPQMLALRKHQLTLVSMLVYAAGAFRLLRYLQHLHPDSSVVWDLDSQVLSHVSYILCYARCLVDDGSWELLPYLPDDSFDNDFGVVIETPVLSGQDNNVRAWARSDLRRAYRQGWRRQGDFWLVTVGSSEAHIADPLPAAEDTRPDELAKEAWNLQKELWKDQQRENPVPELDDLVIGY